MRVDLFFGVGFTLLVCCWSLLMVRGLEGLKEAGSLKLWLDALVGFVGGVVIGLTLFMLCLLWVMG